MDTSHGGAREGIDLKGGRFAVAPLCTSERDACRLSACDGRKFKGKQDAMYSVCVSPTHRMIHPRQQKHAVKETASSSEEVKSLNIQQYRNSALSQAVGLGNHDACSRKTLTAFA